MPYFTPNFLFVDRAAPNGGNGSISKPFNTAAAAIAAAPSLPDTATIFLIGRGGFESEGFIPYVDKRLTFQGCAFLNQSPDPPTHGLFLAPTFTGGGAIVEIEGTNCGVDAQTFGTVVILRNAYCEAFGTHRARYEMSGSPLTCRMGTINPADTEAIDQVVMIGSYAGNYTAQGNLTASGGSVLSGTYITLPNPAAGHRVDGCEFAVTTFSFTGSLDISASWFSVPTTFTGGGTVVVDYATFRRGVLAGVSWPPTTIIIDRPPLPLLRSIGPGSNTGGDLVLSYGAPVAAGDYFTAQINCVGVQPPATPAGWVLLNTQVSGGVTQRIYERIARSTGTEVGTVTWTIPAGNLPNQGRIYGWGNVGVAVASESPSNIVNAAGVAPGPTVPTLGVGRTAVVYYATNSDLVGSTTPPIAGAVGGSWGGRAAHPSGAGGNILLYTAPMLEAGTISGGSATIGSGTAAVAGFAHALVPA